MSNLNMRGQGQEELEPGQHIAGYRIQKKIGEGAMAILYLVTDSDGQQHTLKIPRQLLGVDPVSLVAFENELRLAPYLQDLASASRPKVIAHGQQNLLLMDYIDGIDLWAHLTCHGCLSEDEAITLIKKVVCAVRELHQQRIIHLDLKLSNVMFTTEGEVRLIDFGLSTHLDLPDLIYESFNDPKGTPAYIAPEQFIGIRDDFRSDIFSIGVMLYEMTTNKLPYSEGNTSLDVISRIKKEIVLPKKYNSNLSETFNYLVATCLYANPDMRFSDIDHLHEMLGMWEGDMPVDQIMGLCKKEEKRTKNPVSRLLKPAYLAMRNLLNFTPDNYQRLKQWAEYRRKHQKEKPYRILVAVKLDHAMKLTPFNIEIIEEACYLANLHKAAITIVSAIENNSGMASGEQEAKVNNELCNKARIAICSIIKESQKHDLAIGVNVQVGGPLDVLENCVENYNADLLIIGAKEKQKLSQYMQGHDTNRITSQVKCNTYIVWQGKGIHSKQITDKDVYNNFTEKTQKAN